MATTRIKEILESGAKRVRMPDGSETEFHPPSENLKALQAIQKEDAKAAGTRRRVTRVHLKSGW